MTEMDMTFQQMVEAYLDAIKNRDLRQLLTVITFDEDIDMILFNGTHFKGRELAANLHSAWFSDPDWKLEAQVVRTVETPELAYAFILADYSDEKLRDTPYQAHQYVTLVFRKRNGRWLLTHDQTTAAASQG
jgi:uncharacterized protein (TIGR02246 family)